MLIDLSNGSAVGTTPTLDAFSEAIGELAETWVPRLWDAGHLDLALQLRRLAQTSRSA